jgi:uncharacterized protein (DUF362 family)
MERSTAATASFVDDPAVAVVRDRPAYPRQPPFAPSDSFPEWPGLPRGDEDNPAYRAVRLALLHLGLDAARFGSPAWDPLGDLLSPGQTVAIKPNFVRHRSLGASGTVDTDCLVTHGAVVRAVVDYSAKALRGRGRVVVADCPVQGARWDDLVRLVGLEPILRDARRRFPGVEFVSRDYRLTRASSIAGMTVAHSDEANPAQYVEVDLGRDSLLVPLMEGSYAFGVSQYPRHRMRRAHTPETNRYVIPRELLEADLFINLPKMKSHQKAGVTCALKNLVGVNGHKDYLPHFRFGSPSTGGDEYPDGNALWDLYWRLCHREWDGGPAKVLFKASSAACEEILRRVLRMPRGRLAQGGGSWYGNDTLWRTVLDINRAFLHYDRAAGLVTDGSARRYLAILDGLVGGDRESPLSPAPVASGLVLAARNPLALDTVATALMGLDWRRIPQIRNGYEVGRWPIASFGPGDIAIRGLRGIGSLEDAERSSEFVRFEPSHGWKGHVELPAAGANVGQARVDAA